MPVPIKSSYTLPNDMGAIQREPNNVGFWDAFSATFSYQYMPLLDRAGEAYEFGSRSYQPTFDPFTESNRAGYEEYLDELARAKDAEHLAHIKSDIDRRLETKQTLADAGLSNAGVWVGAFIDPLNIAFAIPVWGQLGLMAKGGMTVRQAAAASAKGGFVAGLVSEGIRAPFDKTNTFTETGLNLASYTAVSTIFGSVPSLARASINSTRKGIAMRNEVYQKKGALPEAVDGITISKKADVAETRQQTALAPVAAKKAKPDVGVSYNTKTKAIDVNEAIVNKTFDQRAWVRPEIKDADPFREADFKTPQEWSDFLVFREAERSKGTRKKGESQVAYVNRTNKQAYKRAIEGQELAQTPFTKSVAYKMLTTPGKRIMADAPDVMKRAYHLLAGVDQYETAGVVAGKTQHQSVFRQSKTHMARSVNAINRMQKLWSKDVLTKSQSTKIFGFNTDDIVAKWRGSQTFDQWFEAVVDARLEQQAGKFNKYDGSFSKPFRAAMREMDGFFKDYQVDLKDLNMINDGVTLRADITRLQKEIKALEGIEKATGLTDRQLKRIKSSKEHVEFLEALVEARFKDRYIFPIYYDKAKLQSDPKLKQRLITVFEEWVRTNPITKVWNDETGKMVDIDPLTRKNPYKVAKDAVDAIMEEGDPITHLERAIGAPKGKHLRHRMIDIPEHLISDFIIKDPSVMHSYALRVGRRMEYVRNFGNRSIDDLLEEFEFEMREQGLSEKKISTMRRDFAFEYERVMGEFVKNPDRWDAQIGRGLKEIAGMSYLDAAAVASITDVANIIMERGLGKFFAPMRTEIDRGLMRKARANVARTGEALELDLGQVQQRFIADNIEGISPNLQERIFAPFTRLYYNIPVLGNGLGAMTYWMKRIDGTHRSNYYMDTLIKWSNGSAKTADVRYMQRMGFSEQDANIIASYPHEKGDRYIFANIDKWPNKTKQERELLLKWDTAMNAGIGNTIMHATSFDKPIVMDGVVYARYRPWMKQLGLEIDQRASTSSIKLARIESQALTFPFQFFNFMLAATNRITAGMFNPMKQHRMIGAMVLFGLGYSVLRLKNDDWWFDARDNTEIFQRSLDQSGLLGVYGEIAYSITHMAVGMGLMDADDAPLRPKYSPDMQDALSEPLGAAPGMLWAWARAGAAFFEGDTDEAAEQFKYNHPTTPLFSLAQDMLD
jgi:hypothetical protein